MEKIQPTVLQLDKKHAKNWDYEKALEAIGIAWMHIDEMPDFFAGLMKGEEGVVTLKLQYCRDFNEDYCLKILEEDHMMIKPWPKGFGPK